MKCQNAKIFKYSFLIGLLLCTLAAQADAVKSCKDYDIYSKECTVGRILATQVDECEWTLTPQCSSGKFKSWVYDPATVTIVEPENPTTHAITIELTVSEDTIPVSAEFTYTLPYCKSCRDFKVYDSVPHLSYGGISAQKVDTCWQLTAVPKPGHYFVQWSDGTASNPRTIDADSIKNDTITYTAYFKPLTTIMVSGVYVSSDKWAKIDQWDVNGTSGGEITVTAQTNTTISGKEQYSATIFFDGKPAGTFHVKNVTNNKDVDEGVYKLTYTSAYDASTMAGKKCHIFFRNQKCEPMAVVLDTIIPYLVTGTKTVGALNMKDRETYGVHVLEGATANFSVDQSIAELDIYPGGKANIAANVEATSVIMRADWIASGDDGKVPQLNISSGSLTNTSNKVYYDAKVNFHYYSFGLPVNVSTSAVTYRSGIDATDRFGLDYYNGYTRATSGSGGWQDYYNNPASPQTITGGVGYNIYAEPYEWNGNAQDVYGANLRFPMTINLTSAPGAKTIDVDTHEAASAQNKNWNLIASPYVTAFQGTITAIKSDESDEELAYITFPNNKNFNGGYDHKEVSGATIMPFSAYFVQVPDNTDSLRFEAGSTKLGAPRRAIKAVDADRIKAGLTLTQADKSDHAGLLIGEKYTNDYDINADLAKMFDSNSGLALFMLSGSEKLAYIALPPAEGNGVSETVIPLGYNKAAMGQEMTFAFDEDRYPSVRFDERIQALELIDYVEGSTTNLLQEPYTCTAYEKADNTRFALGIRYTKTGANVTTGICDDVAASKVNDGIYDLMGRRVNADDARSLGAGVYIIMENGKARKEVIR